MVIREEADIDVSVPLSGLIFVNVTEFKDDLDLAQVSVPLSGLIFVNFDNTANAIDDKDWVSVPLSGLIFVNFSIILFCKWT